MSLVDGFATEASPHTLAARCRTLARHPIAIVAVLFFCIYSIPFMSNWREKTWTKLFTVSAAHMRAGEKLHRYDEGDIYVYPPAIALFSIPLTSFPKIPSLIGWYLLNVAAALTTIVCAWKLAGGVALSGLNKKWLAVLGLGLGLSGRYFLSPFENHQYDMIIAALLLGGCVHLWRGHDLRGAALLGTCTALKCTPWLFGPYLLWRGKLKAACLFGVVAIGWNLAPDVLYPQTNGNSYLADWFRETLTPAERSAPGQWISGGAAQSLNQSLGGMVHRFMTFGPMLSTDAVPDPNLPNLASGQDRLLRRVLILGIGLALVMVTGACFGRARQPLPIVPARSRLPLAADELRLGWECAGIVCLMLLLSPMSSKAHYVVMILPAMLLARSTIERRGLLMPGLALALLAVGSLSVKGILGKRLGDLALMWGCPTWYVLLTLVAVWIMRRRIEQEQAAMQSLRIDAPRALRPSPSARAA